MLELMVMSPSERQNKRKVLNSHNLPALSPDKNPDANCKASLSE